MNPSLFPTFTADQSSPTPSLSDSKRGISYGALAAIATTPHGARLLIPLCQAINQTINPSSQTDRSMTAEQQMVVWVPPTVAETLEHLDNVKCYSGSLKEHLTSLWPCHQGFIFCVAMGAVVRLIAPLVDDKQSDPAVVVLDENGRHVISACSGHQGQADDLAQWIATQIEAIPVLTGASNRDRRAGVDVMGRPFGWAKGPGDWTTLSAALARQEPVHVIQDAGTRLWQQHLPPKHTYQFSDPRSSLAMSPTPSVPTLWISPIQHLFPASKIQERPTPNPSQEGERPTPNPSQEGERCSPTFQYANVNPKSKIKNPQAQWYPRVLWVGIGCERHTPKAVIEAAIQQTCSQHRLAEEAIAGIATIDLKADEQGLVALCDARHWPLRCFSAEQLQSMAVPNPSPVVEQAVGTPSVAEAAALLAARSGGTPLLASSPTSMSGGEGSQNNGVDHQDASRPNGQPPVTAPPLLTSKQIYRLPEHPGAVTVAIAQAATEYINRPGQLALVGMGPGQLSQMTPAAKGAIVNADAVIGYGLYLELMRPLFKPGQIVESLPITQERQRAERAIALAQWGLSVAVVSSGDCGIYGMAGLVMEQLQQSGWDGQTPSVQVFPGVTALQAAASRVGAPLMHDFCAISLSDLLTPWAVIEKRLTAAAQADFVTALYNPKSKTRIQQIAIAHRIFLNHRTPDIPVALVRCAYRDDEEITLTTLETMLDHPIDMMTLVLIGNSNTRRLEQWLITPRGYLSHEGAEQTNV